MSSSFTSLAIMTGFERRYGVLKRLGASPLPRHGLLLGKMGALLPFSAVQAGDHRGGRRGPGLAAATAGAAAGRRSARRPGRDRRIRGSLGLLLAGTLRAEATLAAANLVYLLLLAGGGVVAAHDVVRRARTAACPGCLRGAGRRHAGRVPRRSGSAGQPARCSLVWAAVGALLTAGPSRGNEVALPGLSRPAARWVRRMGWATLVANIGIIVTGGAVRLTGSGLGLPHLAAVHRGVVHPPRRGWTSTPLIEFGNRILTFVLVAVASARFWRLGGAAGRPDPRSRSSSALGIPAQARHRRRHRAHRPQPLGRLAAPVCSLGIIALARAVPAADRPRGRRSVRDGAIAGSPG